MSYIKQLQKENAERAQQLADISAQLTIFRIELLSAKFYGTDSSGERRDWMSTADIQERLEKISALTL